VTEVADVTDAPAVQAPSLDMLPVGGLPVGELPVADLPVGDLQGSPALSGLDTASALDGASLSATRAALANLFTINPIG
jgi:hypothetical protein